MYDMFGLFCFFYLACDKVVIGEYHRNCFTLDVKKLYFPFRIFVFFMAFKLLMPLSIIFQLYRGGQFNLWRKSEDPVKTTDHNVVHLALTEIRTHDIGGDMH